jgi:hypothetical protein
MSETTQAQASVANEAIQDPAPRMNPAPVTSVSLMRGVQVDGEWLSDATIRELNGEDEETIASLTNKEGLVYSDYMSALLKRAVLSIGNINVAQNPNVIEDLMIGDRDLLFVGAMKATYGRFREMEVTCGNCDSSNFVTLNLDEDFKFERPKKDFTKPIEVELRNGAVINVSYPTGGDSGFVAKKAKTVAEQNTLMIARCCDLGDDLSSQEKEQWARSLGVSDRNKLVRALTSNPPGPKMEEVKTQCAKCQEDLIILMDWVSLLFG